MPKLLIFDAFTLLIPEKTVANYALLRCKTFSLKIWVCKIFDKFHVCIIGLLNDQKPELFRGVFCNFGFGGVWIPLLYLNEGHAVRCDSYSTKTARTLFHTRPKLPKPFCQPTSSNMREGGRKSLSSVEILYISFI